VYHIPDTQGRLLYIGYARDPVQRLKRHRYYQAQLPQGHPRNWWHQVHPEVRATYRTTVRWYPTKQAAIAAERADIRRLRPPANRITYKGAAKSWTRR